MSLDKEAFETMHPFRAIWTLSWPLVLMMFFHFMIGFTDVYVAGLLNDESQAALGLVTSTLFFFLILAIAVGNGTVAAVSQSLGAGNVLRAKRYAGLALVSACVFGVFISVAGYAFRDVYLDAVQAPPSIRDILLDFYDISLLTLPPYYVLIIGNCLFRARKEVMLPLTAMFCTMLVNGAADFGLGLGLFGLPRMEHEGLAWATFFSIVSGAVCVVVMLRRKGMLGRKALPPMRWARKGLPYLFKVAWPVGLMQTLWHAGYLALFSVTASLPSEPVTAMAAMTAGLRIESLLFLPGFALNMSASVFVGHYLGAGKFDEAKRFGYRILWLGVALIGAATVAVWLAAEESAAMLSISEPVREEIVDYLNYNLAAMPFTLTTMILGGAFVGAGATLYNLWIFGSAVWLFRLPLAVLMGHRVWGEADGVWLSMLASQVLQAVVMLYVFARKDWGRFAMAGKKKKTMTIRSTAAGMQQR